MIDRLDAAAEHISRFLAVFAGLFLVGMMLLACANMVSRAFWEPVKGTFELMGYMGAVTAAFSLPYAQRAKAHVAVGLLMSLFPAFMRRTLDCLVHLASTAFFGWAGIKAWKWASFLVETGEISETLRMIYYPFVFALSIGCLALAFTLFIDFLKAATGRSEH